MGPALCINHPGGRSICLFDSFDFPDFQDPIVLRVLRAFSSCQVFSQIAATAEPDRILDFAFVNDDDRVGIFAIRGPR